MTKTEIDRAFTYQKPGLIETGIYQNIRDGAKTLALIIDAVCFDNREKSLALTKLREAVMWANASVALHGAVEKKQCLTR